MSRLLPPNPDLLHLKRQAKSLLRALRSNDPEAIERIGTAIPGKAFNSEGFRLADCQFVIAREYGFQSWVKLKAHVEAVRAGAQGVESVLQAFRQSVVQGNLNGLLALSENYPWLPTHDIFAACSYGDIDTIRKFITQFPNLAVESDGCNEGWTPLAYACFSPMNRRESGGQIFASIAELLLAEGADPDTIVYLPGQNERPLSCLYGAVGLNRNYPLGEMLLKAGANPNDNESLYHSAEHPDNNCLKLLLSYKANPAGTNALLRKLDFDDIEGLELLLAHGADPDDQGISAMCHALSRGRGTGHFEVLLEAGANPEGKDRDGISVCQNAVVRGRADVIELLEKTGVSYTASPEERLLEHCSRQDRDSAIKLMNEHPGLWERLSENQAGRLSESIWNGENATALLMLDLGAPVNRAGSSIGPPLHAAAWMGNAHMTMALLERGADIHLLDEAYNLSALGWALHGSLHARNPDEQYIYAEADYCGVIRLLLERGAVLPDSILASDEILEYLEAFHGV